MLQRLKNAPIDSSLYVIGFVVGCLKLLLSGVLIYSIKMSDFSASDFALLVGSLGGVHIARRHSDNVTINKEEVQ